jgi:hypothetical protein
MTIVDLFMLLNVCKNLYSIISLNEYYIQLSKELLCYRKNSSYNDLEKIIEYKYLSNKISKSKLQRIFVYACKHNKISTFKLLLNDNNIKLNELKKGRNVSKHNDIHNILIKIVPYSN